MCLGPDTGPDANDDIPGVFCRFEDDPILIYLEVPRCFEDVLKPYCDGDPFVNRDCSFPSPDGDATCSGDQVACCNATAPGNTPPRTCDPNGDAGFPGP